MIILSYMTTGPVVQAQSILEHSSYSPKEKALLVVVDARMIVKYGFMLVVYFWGT